MSLAAQSLWLMKEAENEVMAVLCLVKSLSEQELIQSLFSVTAGHGQLWSPGC